MLKEIKFRAWHKEKHKMFEVQKMSFKTGKILPYGWNMEHDGIEFELMQYTGLKDKNGKEVFEGDIVTDGTINYVVAFYAGSWRLKQNIDGDTWWKSLYRYVANFKVEVIGNVYENPAFLKEGK